MELETIMDFYDEILPLTIEDADEAQAMCWDPDEDDLRGTEAADMEAAQAAQEAAEAAYTGEELAALFGAEALAYIIRHPDGWINIMLSPAITGMGEAAEHPEMRWLQAAEAARLKKLLQL